MAISDRIVITGVGLTSLNGANLADFRRNLLAGVSGVTAMETRFMGKVLAGVCRFDEQKYQTRKDRRRGTRAGERPRSEHKLVLGSKRVHARVDLVVQQLRCRATSANV
jgi:hypothetical protein